MGDRGIEQDESGVRCGPDEVRVHAAPEAARSLVRLPVPVHLRELPGASGLGRVHAGAAHLRRQQAGRRQGGVANDLRLEAEAVLTGQQPVARVHRGGIGAMGGSLAVGGRVQDQSVHVLQIPAAAHEFRGQPVQQLRMAGRVALRAEIVLGLYDSDAEVALPESVHGDPGRERVVVGDQPARQAQPIARQIGLHPGQDSQRARLDRIAATGEVALHVDIGIARLGQVAHDHRPRDLGQLLSEFADLLLLGLELGHAAGENPVQDGVLDRRAVLRL